MIVTVCYFLKSMKSVFILVQCNISLSKNYVAHSVSVVCVIGWIWIKNWFVYTLWLSVHMKSVIKQRFFQEFAFNNKMLKTFVEFQIWWTLAIRTSNSNSYFVTSLYVSSEVVSQLTLTDGQTCVSEWGLSAVCREN